MRTNRYSRRPPGTLLVAAISLSLGVAAGCVNEQGIQNPPGAWSYKQNEEAPIDNKESEIAGPQSRSGEHTSDLYPSIGGTGGYRGVHQPRLHHSGSGGEKGEAQHAGAEAGHGRVGSASNHQETRAGGGTAGFGGGGGVIRQGVGSGYSPEPPRPSDGFEIAESDLKTTGQPVARSASSLPPVPLKKRTPSPSRAGSAAGRASGGRATQAPSATTGGPVTPPLTNANPVIGVRTGEAGSGP